MEPFQRIRAAAAALPIDNIDTDQIIPARFLKITDRSGLGEALFADWRYGAEGRERSDFPLNRPSARGAAVLVTGRNFGCGSSREHAPWALLAYGFRAVISTAFADIFSANALTNGLLPVVLSEAAHLRLMELIAAGQVQVDIDLEEQRVILPDGSVEVFPITPFERHCLLHGVDRLGFLLGLDREVERFEQQHMSGPLTSQESS